MGRSKNENKNKVTCKLGRMLKERDMTQREFATLIEMSESNVSYWIKGRHLPEMWVIPKVAKALKLPVEDVFKLFGIK